ncbi:MAG: long-chain fatty acid--CoA ligase [Verrucomicrobia bacterium]|nr:long-chain fatty acid--CoA ligase [Verrucomicrobiota bacterium]
MSSPLSTTPTRVFDLLAYQQAHFPKTDSLAYKVNGTWVKFSTAEVLSIVEQLACGLHLTGIRAGDKIINVTDNNRPEWNFVDLAIMTLGGVHVPIYPNASADDYRFILADAHPHLVFVSNQRLLERIRPLAAEVSEIRNIYTYDEIAGVDSWKKLAEAGKAALLDGGVREKLAEARAAVKPEDLATLIYTSGTTGQPKGVMLSHANLVSNALAAAEILRPCGHERALSFLPLCHIYERTVVNMYAYVGTSIYYAENLDSVGQNLREVRPDTFTTVPRLLEKIYERILARGEELTGLKRRIFFWAVNLGLNFDPDSPCPWFKRLQLAVADLLVFRKWREAVGGRISGIISGSAALQPRLARVFWAAGITVWEGYGPTEAAPVISVNRPKTKLHKLGTVGPVIPGGEVKIAEDGEILYRGPNVMMGYYKRPDLTKETIDSEGWLHTGDVGEMDGPFLKITDRKKEIFKTSGGKYVAPQQVENQLKASRFIAQCIVVGENHKFPAALIVPQFEAVRSWLAAEGESIEAVSEMCKHPKVIKLIQSEVDQSNSLFGRYSQVKKFALLDEEWTIASGELTPTLKLKRKQILKKHASEIAALYEKEELAASAYQG